MFLPRLVIRNLSRHKRRVFITALIIAFAILVYIMIEGLMMGLTEISFANIINLDSGHLQITDRNYFADRDELPLKNLLTPTREIEEQIEATAGLGAYTRRLDFSVNLNNGIDELPVKGVGIDPGKDPAVFDLEKHLISGRMPTAGSREIIMGARLADLMDFEIGDYGIMLIRTAEQTFNTIDGEIVGLFNTPHPSLNDSTVFIPLSTAQASLNLGDKISHYVLRMEDRQRGITAVEDLNPALNDPLRAYSWRSTSENLIYMLELQQIETQIVLAIILTIAAVGIVNTVILSALERMEELGMMKAMGMREKEIVHIFMGEAAGIGLIGGIMGLIMGAIGLYIFNHYGIDMSTLAGGGEITYGFPVSGTIYAGWSIASFVFVFSYGLFVSILASIFPALWAARKDPIKAIYHR